MKPYDFLAMVPIVEGAGGRISHWRVRARFIASFYRIHPFSVGSSCGDGPKHHLGPTA